jgi:hypothetical protein
MKSKARPFPSAFVPRVFQKIQKAQREKRFLVIRHLGDRLRCDHCGRMNATQAICLTLTSQDAVADFEQVGPVYLNGEVYMVGSTCLRELKAQWEII